MSIKVGLYDFFAYIVPGSFFIFTVIYFLFIVGVIKIDFQLVNNLSVFSIIALSVIAFIVGLIIDRFARLWQRRFFRSKYTSDEVLEDFQATHPNLKFNFQGKEWAILLAFLRKSNPDLIADTVERHNASNIMLRSISLTLMLLSLVQGINIIKLNWNIWHAVLCLIFIISSILIGKESARRKQWFYRTIYEAVIAGQMQFSDLVSSNKDGVLEKKPNQ